MVKTPKRPPTILTKHFPKKGERFIDGEWVMPEPEIPQPQTSRAMEARNFYRKQAGWPLLRIKE